MTTTHTPASRIPAIKTGQALQSLRDSGHSLPTALGEPIDNSLEARANEIEIRLDQARDSKGKRHVHRIAIADDGEGMDTDILHHYLVLGFSTRYMHTDTIGKYGVGAKLAALNFARRIDVWSRQRAGEHWLHTHFDLDEAIREENEGGNAGIDAPDRQSVPEDLADLLPKGSGTLVVWSSVDRLEEGRMAPNFDELRLDVEKELSRIFRFFIRGGIKISVNGKNLLAFDPLMLMEDSWSDYALNKAAQNKSATKKVAEHFPAQIIADDPIEIGGHKATLTITLYPREVLRKRGLGGDDLAKQLRLEENKGAISFVRLSREVSYANVPRIFPRGVEDPDRFIGIQVAFDPKMDQFFGVRNVKRGVEPHGELREKIRALLNRYLRRARSAIEEAWGEASREDQQHYGEHGVIAKAAKEANRVMPKGRATGPASEQEQQQILSDLATDVVGSDDEQAKQDYLQKIEDQPFVIESVDWVGPTFIDIKHLPDKVIIRVNTRHRFYREMWEPLKSIAQREAGSVSGEEAVKAARRTIEAITLLLIAFGKAESMDDNPDEKYSDLTHFWGQFLDTLLSKVKGVF
jgi:hypothetical protein